MADDYTEYDFSGNQPSFDTEFGIQGGGIDSLQNAIDTNALKDILAGINFQGDMDLTGGAKSTDLSNILAELSNLGTDSGPASNMGMDQSLLDQLGLSNLNAADANAADNIDVGGGWNPATGKGDTKTAQAAASTGVTSSAYTPHGDTTTPGKTVTFDNTKTDQKPVTPTSKVTTPTGTPAGDKKGMDPMTMMLLMYLMSQMGKSGGSSGTQASIPQLQANQRMLPYTAPSRPGAGGQTYFSPTTYTPKASGGMIGYADGGGISTLGGYSDGGRLLRGPGDGVSDNIPATIAGKQPARLADGEFVVPARIVSELGNGSTDAGAKRLYEMMDRVQKARRKTKNVAADTKAAKYLPA